MNADWLLWLLLITAVAVTCIQTVRAIYWQRQAHGWRMRAMNAARELSLRTVK